VTQPFLTGMENEERRRDLSQFYTPRDLAVRVAQWMLVTCGQPTSVLEPAAGPGSLVVAARELLPHAHIVAYETHISNVETLKASGFASEVHARDFLAASDVTRCDVALQNPPFEDDGMICFPEHALDFCMRATSILPSNVEHSSGRYRKFWRWHDCQRKVTITKRPVFGGDCSPMADFVVMDLVRRNQSRKQGEPTAMIHEFW